MTEHSETVLEFLREYDGPAPTLKIAQHIHGPGSSKKTINRELYAMEKSGMIRKICESNGGKPRWVIEN